MSVKYGWCKNHAPTISIHNAELRRAHAGISAGKYITESLKRYTFRRLCSAMVICCWYRSSLKRVFQMKKSGENVVACTMEAQESRYFLSIFEQMCWCCLLISCMARFHFTSLPTACMLVDSPRSFKFPCGQTWCSHICFNWEHTKNWFIFSSSRMCDFRPCRVYIGMKWVQVMCRIGGSGGGSEICKSIVGVQKEA